MTNKEITERLFKRLQDENGDKKRIFPHYKGHFTTLIIDELEQIQEPTPPVDVEPVDIEQIVKEYGRYDSTFLANSRKYSGLFLTIEDIKDYLLPQASLAKDKQIEELKLKMSQLLVAGNIFPITDNEILDLIKIERHFHGNNVSTFQLLSVKLQAKLITLQSKLDEAVGWIRKANQFIQNGIEYGKIILPIDTPTDSANNTPDDLMMYLHKIELEKWYKDMESAKSLPEQKPERIDDEN